MNGMAPTREAGLDAEAEQVLVERMRRNDEAAFEQMVRVAGAGMLATARRMLGSEHDASDAVQDAFLSAFKSLDRFDCRSRLTTWLHRITVNACLMKMRTKRRRPERPIDELLPQFLEDGHHRHPPRPWNSPQIAETEQAEIRAIVRPKIDELPERYRVILVLRDIEELDTFETAKVLGITPTAVKTRLHRARQALRTLLAPFFADGIGV